jgi:hypothetical protein
VDEQGTSGPQLDAMLDRVVGKFDSTRRLWPVSARLSLWLALELAILTFVGLTAPRPDLETQLGNLRYALELSTLLSMGTLAAVLALRSAIPGREATRNELLMISTLAMVAVALVWGESQPPVRLDQFMQKGIKCVGCETLLAALPWFVLFWAVRRGTPLVAGTAGGLVGLAAFSFAFAATRLGCPIDSPLHLLTWHVLPIAVGTCVSALVGIAWLQSRAWTGPRRHIFPDDLLD